MKKKSFKKCNKICKMIINCLITKKKQEKSDENRTKGNMSIPMTIQSWTCPHRLNKRGHVHTKNGYNFTI